MFPISLNLIKICLLGDRGRRRSKFVLYRRQKANGVAKLRHYKVKTAHSAEAIQNNQQHSISYTLSRNQAVIVEYAPDANSDLFQVGSTFCYLISLSVFKLMPMLSDWKELRVAHRLRCDGHCSWQLRARQSQQPVNHIQVSHSSHSHGVTLRTVNYYRQYSRKALRKM